MTVTDPILLARRAAACRHWRWLPGSRTKAGGRRLTETGARSIPPINAVPDLSDPATLGCLLALVREHFPGCHAEPNGALECDSDDEDERAHWWAVYACNPHRRVSTGATEAEALIAALEGAP